MKLSYKKKAMEENVIPLVSKFKKKVAYDQIKKTKN